MAGAALQCMPRFLRFLLVVACNVPLAASGMDVQHCSCGIHTPPQVPPDLGLGPGNAGIATACLLYHLPPRVALTLIAALLMERRIILVGALQGVLFSWGGV